MPMQRYWIQVKNINIVLEENVVESWTAKDKILYLRPRSSPVLREQGPVPSLVLSSAPVYKVIVHLL